ncbi:hypothetical protein RHMOL_Rhmol07G0215300 [Rhododendron molle]|uniref:Uncharacterized protein n=1 Tax=Rhododendron molle TaxID=49168 RepID=A0ACC0N347_RHOML|nr:hypothetical protein RHMOL_Rhmol07G0215300 [Rhododendron molle]
MHPKPIPVSSCSAYIALETTGGQTSLPPSPFPARRNSNEENNVQGLVIGLLVLFVFLTTVVCLVQVSIDLIEIAEIEPAANPQFKVNSASFSLSNNILSSSRVIKGEITFNVTKPLNCTIVFFDKIVVSLFHAERPLSIAITEPFFQNESNHTMVKAIFPPTRNAPHVETRDPKGMPSGDFNSFEYLSFDVNAKGRLWPNLETREDFIEYGRQMYVWCPDVKVRILVKTGVGMMEGEPAKCKVQNFYR